MRPEPLARRLGAWACLALGALALGGGLLTRHEVGQLREGRRSLTRKVEVVTELDLVVDATFSGVARQDGRLDSTYDRTRPRTGKRDCPT